MGFFPIILFAQEKSYMKWAFKTSVGYSLPLIDFPKGHVTDHLIGNSRDRFYGQIPSFLYFWNPHWGLELTMTIYNFEDTTDKQYASFISELTKLYPDHFISSHSYLQTAMTGLKIGPIYKWEKDRFIYFLGLPVVSFLNIETPEIELRMKRENSHEIIRLHYSRFPHDEFSYSKFLYNFSPHFSLGYRLSNYIVLNCDAGINLYKAKFSYTESAYNLLDNQTTTKNYLYNKWVGDLNFGISLLFVLKNQK